MKINTLRGNVTLIIYLVDMCVSKTFVLMAHHLHTQMIIYQAHSPRGTLILILSIQNSLQIVDFESP